MKIAVFGGTFNPAHLGHLRNAEDFISRLSLDKVLIIPTFVPPHKKAHMLASGEDRLEMCRRTFTGEKFEVSDMELKRQGKSYTVDTLTAIKEKYPDSDLYLIIGSDMLLSFHEWREYRKILAMSKLCVMTRSEKIDTAKMKKYAEETLNIKDGNIFFSDLAPMEISSTDIRNAIRNDEEITSVTDSTRLYIKEKGMYRKNSPEDLKEILASRLSEKRYIHSLGVAEKAKELAEIYGEDPKRAYITGLVHDITKNTPDDEQLQIIKNGGIILTSEEKNNPNLYHAISGSVYIRDFLGFKDEEMISAVRYHTTGKAKMTKLEKIIYIADFISEERDFSGVDFMRELAKESLDKACLFAVDFCIPNLVERRCVLHSDSIELYNELIINHIEYERKM